MAMLSVLQQPASAASDACPSGTEKPPQPRRAGCDQGPLIPLPSRHRNV